jgi:spore germination cell wall hydrolase CwlJ-like protein
LRILLVLAGLAAAALASAAQADGQPAPAKKDLACLAEAVYFEARGTGTEGEAAVAHVIVNRTNAPEFPSSVCGVVTQGCQFSYRCDGRSDALADARARARAYAVAEAVLATDDDPTNGALFFTRPRRDPAGSRSASASPASAATSSIADLPSTRLRRPWSSAPHFLSWT